MTGFGLDRSQYSPPGLIWSHLRVFHHLAPLYAFCPEIAREFRRGIRNRLERALQQCVAHLRRIDDGFNFALQLVDYGG